MELHRRKNSLPFFEYLTRPFLDVVIVLFVFFVIICNTYFQLEPQFFLVTLISMVGTA